MQQASRLAPEAVQVQVDWGHARHASQALLRLVQGYGARVEPHGFDEAYVDYTGCERIHGAPLDVARQLLQRLVYPGTMALGIGSTPFGDVT